MYGSTYEQDAARTPALAREGPTLAECRIIGVELACTPWDRGEVELEMFSCCHTIPLGGPGYPPFNFRVTLHTSRGDRTMREAFTL